MPDSTPKPSEIAPERWEKALAYYADSSREDLIEELLHLGEAYCDLPKLVRPEPPGADSPKPSGAIERVRRALTENSSALYGYGDAAVLLAEYDRLRGLLDGSASLLNRLREFVADELAVRRASFMPEPSASESAQIKDAEGLLAELHARLTASGASK